MSYITNQWVKMNPFEAANRLTELERENAALRAALTGTLDRLEFYIDCLPIDKVAYLKTLEGKITNQVINNARAAIDAARKEKE